MSAGDVDGWPVWVRTWVLPYLGESALLPVWLAIWGHVILLLGLSMLATWRGGSIVPLLGWTLGSVGLLAWELRLFRRPGRVGAWIVLSWIFGLGIAWLGERTGVF